MRPLLNSTSIDLMSKDEQDTRRLAQERDQSMNARFSTGLQGTISRGFSQ